MHCGAVIHSIPVLFGVEMGAGCRTESSQERYLSMINLVDATQNQRVDFYLPGRCRDYYVRAIRQETLTLCVSFWPILIVTDCGGSQTISTGMLASKPTVVLRVWMSIGLGPSN